MNLRVVLAIAQKDIVDAVKNLYILFALLVPVGMSLLFNVIFPHTDDALKLSVAVYDPASSHLVAALRSNPAIKVTNVTSEQQLLEAVQKDAVGGIAVPAGFDDAVKSGQKPVLTAYVNQQHAGSEIAAFRLVLQQQVWSLVGQAQPAELKWTDVGAPLFNEPPGGFSVEHYLLVMLLVMSLAMAGVFVVPTLLVEEKEKHTLQALMVSPARTSEIVAGKALTGLVYSLIVSAILIALNHGWAGEWYITFLAVLLGSLFCVVVGLWMGAAFRYSQQVNTWSTVVLLALMLPSWTTLFGLPALLDTFERLIPTYYITRALSLALAGQADWSQIGLDLAVVLVSTVIAFALVVWTLQRQERVVA